MFTRVASCWRIPNGCDYSNAQTENRFFENEETANEFAKPLGYPPEMVIVITTQEYNEIVKKIGRLKKNF